MSHYFQLLGSDTPNGYGGCCYYGPLDHPVFQEPTAVPQKAGHDASLRISAVTAVDAWSEGGASRVSPSPHIKQNLSMHSNFPLTNSSKTATSSFQDAGIVGSENAATTTAAAAPQPAWNWSSYLHAPRPTWPTSGPLHLASLLQPTSPSTFFSAAAPPSFAADTGSSGNEGYIFFNCPEGTQRFSSEANIKLKKVRCFCFTRWNSTNRSCAATTESRSETALPLKSEKRKTVGAASAVMGLPGMLFTINDAGSRQATFFGPSVGIDHPEGVCSTAALPTNALSSSAHASRSSTGIRQFLTALRFHYFQYRPMLFRQLHGVRSCTTHLPRLSSNESVSTDDANSKAAMAGNEIHFVEIADDAAAAEPFFYATVPLSAQSLLAAFRISSGPAVSPKPTSVNKKDRTMKERLGSADAYGSVIDENATSSLAATSALFTICGGSGQDDERHTNHTNDHGTVYSLTDSSHVVLGYAIVVAPGATFDAAKARALGVRSGPKYGQLKQGLSVEVDTDDSPERSNFFKNKRANKETRFTKEAATSDGRAAAASHAAQWVHPYQVLRPTTATRHTYISLVLDSDTPEDVRRALGDLLGKQHKKKNDEGGRDFEGGALLKLLQSKFPHLAFYYDEDVAAVDGPLKHTENENSHMKAADDTRDEPREGFRRRPRQLTVRHVAHVQPASYFEEFRQNRMDQIPRNKTSCCREEQHQQTSRESNNEVHTEDCAHSTPNEEDVYAEYNSYVFADVATAARTDFFDSRESDLNAVRVSLDPSLSFTFAELAEVEDDKISVISATKPMETTAADHPKSSRITCRCTWHLFTSYVQRHFTAFPTALVHRYHLHHIAPTLFPLYGSDMPILKYSADNQNNEGEDVTAPSRLWKDEEDISATESSMEYWPYSLKLRCVPEAGLQLQQEKKSSAHVPRTLVTAGIGTAANHASQKSDKEKSGREGEAVETEAVTGTKAESSPQHTQVPAPPLPLKREKKEPLSESTSTQEEKTLSAALHDHAHGEPTLSTSRSIPLVKTAATHGNRETKPASRHLAVIDGLASLLPCPTPASALALLSDHFLTSITSRSLLKRSPRQSFDVYERAMNNGLIKGGGALGFLGTGSAVPSKYRNVSGTYLELFLPRCCFGDTGARVEKTAIPVDGRHSSSAASASTELRRGVIILDCGEGSAGQLASLCEGAREGVHTQQMHRYNGTSSWCASNAYTEATVDGRDRMERSDSRGDRLREFVLDIVLVFISHAHADHHLGLLSLLTLRHRYLSESQPASPNSCPKLLIVCPTEVYQFMMDTWGSTTPYESWLLEECVFELMPPPLSRHITGVTAEATNGKEERDAANGHSIAEDAFTDRAKHEHHVAGTQPQQHVVLMPLLQAQLSSWNSCISRHLKEGNDSGEVSALTTGAAVLSTNVWWDAEIITVDHPANAHALLLRFPFYSARTAHSAETSVRATLPDSSRVFLFSGDTRPSQFLVERSRAFTTAKGNSTAPVLILLHEATFGPGFEDEAIRKKHSTLPEALEIGAAVEAEFIVLNHFSQRYPKLPGLSEAQLGGKSTDLLCQRRSRFAKTPAPVSSSSATSAKLKRMGALWNEIEVKEGDKEIGGDAGPSLTETKGEDTKEGTEPQQRQEMTLEEEVSSLLADTNTTAQPSTSLYANMSFAFDLMSVSFADMHRGLVPRLTPALVQLLEEYDSWGVGTTHRMRTTRTGDASSGDHYGRKKGKR